MNRYESEEMLLDTFQEAIRLSCETGDRLADIAQLLGRTLSLGADSGIGGEALSRIYQHRDQVQVLERVMEELTASLMELQQVTEQSQFQLLYGPGPDFYSADQDP